MKKVASYALGCKVNQYESEAIGELFEAKGYEMVGIEEVADVYIINTCTVTNLGDKKSRQLIRKVKRQNPQAVVAVVGCYAQTAPEELMQVEGVNLVIGTKDRSKIVEYVESCQADSLPQNMVTDIMKEKIFEPLSIGSLENRTRAYLKIQDGCSQYCSYCIIPYARGPIRSRASQAVLEEVERLATHGFQEVVLTGIHVASYGKDLQNMTLLDLLKQVHEVEGIKRIRLSSIEPTIATREFAEAIKALPKVCRHFHLSLQSGCDATLKAMNRRYTTAQYRQAANTLREVLSDVALTTDVIVGFPGETDSDFAASYAFAEEMGFAKIHVFPYSPKKGTPAAARKDQISNEIKIQRKKALMELSDRMALQFVEQRLGKSYSVLFERETDENRYEGHTQNYIKVWAESDENLKNKEVKVILTETADGGAIGKVTKL